MHDLKKKHFELNMPANFKTFDHLVINDHPINFSDDFIIMIDQIYRVLGI